MIEILKRHITQKQINEIVARIIDRYKEYRQLINKHDINKIFLEEYAPHKKQNTVSWAISSAFPSNTFIEDIKVVCLKYGRGHTRPEFESETAKFHVLNKTTDFEADYLNECYKMNQNWDKNKKIYFYFKFVVRENQLVKISICLPDEYGKVIKEEILVDNVEIIKLVAA